MTSSVQFAVLGPVVAEHPDGPVDLKGPRHRAVLALLLIARGRVVPVRRLVDDLWDDPPASAVATVRTFVSSLRRAVEPDRAPRSPAEVLVTAGPGYALRLPAHAVDAWRFEEAVREAGRLLDAGDPAAARSRAAEALDLWRGPAYAEFADQPWARGEIARLDELRLLAVERHARAALALGHAAETVPDLEAHVGVHPWREDAWGLLSLALYRTGRQTDALAVLRRARQALAAELGLDAGPDLRRLEADILNQAPHLALRPAEAPTAAAAAHPPTAPAGPRPGPLFIGRTDELARLESAAASAVSQHRLGLALISGDAGAGKSALAEALTRRLADRGWTTAWGRSPEYAGAPAAWPWTEIVAALTAAGHPPDPAFTDLDAARPPAEPAAARFRMHQAFGPYLSTVAAAGPVLLVLDDLHWAGEQTLDLLTALAGRPTAGPVLILGTYRTTEISPALAPALGRWARAEPARVHLEGLPEAQVRELVRATAGRDVDGPTARAIHRRTAGNPFFVRELARLLGTGRGSGSGSATGTGTGSATDTDTEADSALSGIPAGVRDVIRHRLTTLPKPTRDVLHLAAVLGLDVDVDLLVAVTGHEERTLDAVESASRSGFLLDAGPERVRFAHALVRDTLYDDLPRPRRARRHAAVAEALEQLRPDRLDALAHHFLRAESPATAARAVHYAQAAAEQAERRFAPHEAARLWRAAVEAQDHSGAGDARTRLASVMGMVRALAVSGDLASARRYRAQAITAAAELDDQALTAKVIGAFDVPAIWTRNDDEALARQVVEVTERTLAALPRGAAETRARLLGTLAVELRGGAGELGRKSAREATAIARRLDDPALLAFALNGRFLHAFEHAGLARRRAGIGTELLELAERHGLLAFEVLGRLILLQARAALADFDAADEHASAALRLAERYELPLVDVFTDGYAALRLTAADRPEQAETAYRALAARLPGTGMRGLEEGLLPLALLCLRVQDGRPAEPVPGTDFGPYEPWARPLELLAAGRHDEARAAARHIPDAPGDLLHEARTCLAAVAAIAVGDRPLMERAHAALLPAAGELAGAGSGILTLGPVARYLGDLCAALGRPGEARAHHRHALAVARKAHAPHWTAAARAALPGKD